MLFAYIALVNIDSSWYFLHRSRLFAVCELPKKNYGVNGVLPSMRPEGLTQRGWGSSGRGS